MFHQNDRGLQAARDRAYVLADSGKFGNAHAVERALIAEGWPNAARALESSFARKALSERCQAATAH
jgi:hypothetical protein